MVVALAFMLAPVLVPQPAVADAGAGWVAPLPALLFVDIIATAVNTVDVAGSNSTMSVGLTGVLAGTATIVYGAYLGVNHVNPGLLAFVLAAGGISWEMGCVAIVRSDSRGLSVQPAHILGETTAAVTFTAHF